jgi:hypothetical protein
MENFDDDFDEIPYQSSGLTCEVCGYDDSIKCYLDPPHENEQPNQILCGEHAAKEGYCCCCGLFCAGMTSFDFTHPGYCDNCYDEVRSNEDDDEEDRGFFDYLDSRDPY